MLSPHKLYDRNPNQRKLFLENKDVVTTLRRSFD